jgi:antitoxin component YwqK of YwqJK toxin-antitoxin module
MCQPSSLFLRSTKKPKTKVMVKIFTLFCFMCISAITSAQSVILKDTKYYSENGELFSGQYFSYFENGSKKSSLSISDGMINGAVTYFFADGKIMETGNYSNNEKDGAWIRWDSEGNKTAEAFFVSGKKNGLWMVWDSKGIKRYEMTYVMGEKTGIWYMWDENGKLIGEKNYGSI